MGSKATLTVAVIVTASALVACSDSSRGAPDTRDAAYQPPSTEGPQTPASPRSSAPQGHADGSRAEVLELPSLRPGQRALVDAGGVRYVYEIRNTRTTSFRSPTSLAEQRAAVPGASGGPSVPSIPDVEHVCDA